MPISSFMHIGLKLRGAQQKFVNNCGVKNSDGTQAYIVFQMNWSCTMHLNCFSKQKKKTMPVNLLNALGLS